MPADDRAMLCAAAERVSLARGELLCRGGTAPLHAHFLDSGIASAVGGRQANRTEVGVLGRETFSGMPLALGIEWSPYDVLVQTPSAQAWRVEAGTFRRLLAERPAMHAVLLRAVYIHLVQIAQSVVSASRDRMDMRLARWLLMCHDRVEGDDIDLTHEFMSVMIAAQRTGVTMTLHVLEGAGLIRAARGRVTVVDRAGLERLAGSNYGLAEDEYRRTMAPPT